MFKSYPTKNDKLPETRHEYTIWNQILAGMFKSLVGKYSWVLMNGFNCRLNEKFTQLLMSHKHTHILSHSLSSGL